MYDSKMAGHSDGGNVGDSVTGAFVGDCVELETGLGVGASVIRVCVRVMGKTVPKTITVDIINGIGIEFILFPVYLYTIFEPNSIIYR